MDILAMVKSYTESLAEHYKKVFETCDIEKHSDYFYADLKAKIGCYTDILNYITKLEEEERNAGK